MNSLLEELSKPFPPSDISWKPGASKDNKCMALAYADLRAYQERLDEVCGLEWSCRYVPWTGKGIICELTLGGVTRSSTGEADAQDEKNNMAGSVSEAMAFKRACAAFGLGRFLYNLPSPWVEFEPASKRISKNGLAELEQRYATWYAKTMAERKAQRQNAPTTAQQAPAAIEGAVADGDALFDTEAQGTPPHAHMWGVGLATFGKDDWDNGARKWVIRTWTKRYSDSIRESASDISDDEKTLVADWIEEKRSELQRVWNEHKAKVQQSAKVTA